MATSKGDWSEAWDSEFWCSYEFNYRWMGNIAHKGILARIIELIYSDGQSVMLFKCDCADQL